MSTCKACAALAYVFVEAPLSSEPLRYSLDFKHRGRIEVRWCVCGQMYFAVALDEWADFIASLPDSRF